MSLIVPVALADASLQFASVPPESSIQDVINILNDVKEVHTDILGDLSYQGWAIQKIMKEETSRAWEEDELEALSDGLVDPGASVASLLGPSDPRPTMRRHFSAFPLTSHLHAPILRLVSLHPTLSVILSFLRVPEIHDGFQRRFYFARETAVENVIESALIELGLPRQSAVLGNVELDYVMEEVWIDGSQESQFF